MSNTFLSASGSGQTSLRFELPCKSNIQIPFELAISERRIPRSVGLLMNVWLLTYAMTE
jgi:hypothetical protein